MSEMTAFENELVKKFERNRHVEVLLDREEGEPFVEVMDRTARRVLDIMARHSLYDYAGEQEYVISNMKYYEPYGWVCSVRIQKADE